MIVQPTPARTPGRRPPLRAVAVILLGVLVAVVAVGVLGEDIPAPTVEPVAREDADQAVTDVSQPSITPDPVDPGFPDEVLGLPVRDVVAVVDERRDASLSGLVAVAGYLALAGRPTECLPVTSGPRVTTAGRARPFCRRDAVIASTPEGASGDPEFDPSAWVEAMAHGPHLHAQVAPGTSLPYAVEPPFGNDRREAVPAVVLASFDDARARAIGCEMVPYCFETLLIEQVLWADGRWQERRRAVEPSLEDPPRLSGRERLLITSLTLPGSGPVLAEAVLPSELLASVDPVAAGQAEATDRPVWYLRLLTRTPTGADGVAWLVLEDVSGRILARGEAG